MSVDNVWKSNSPEEHLRRLEQELKKKDAEKSDYGILLGHLKQLRLGWKNHQQAA